MEIGVCCSLENARLAAAKGFNYVEVSASDMAAMEPWDSSVYAGLNVQATNLFLPGGVSVWTLPPAVVLAQLRKFLPRANEVGVEVAVIGGGGQRNHPFTREMWDARPIPFTPCSTPESAFGKLLYSAISAVYEEEHEAFLGDFVEAASEPPPTREQFHEQLRNAIRSWMSPLLAPEALNRSETNLGNDCGKFATTLAYYGIPYTADVYHILYEWDADGREGGLAVPSEAFWEAQLPFAPVHVHLADLQGRAAPSAHDPMMAGFFRRLKALDYQGRMSLEVRTPFDELNGAAEQIRLAYSQS
ncbi:MAG: hypothetical protein WCK51_10940 [Armatimonadota bacterium]